ncbi:MAG TPA: CinA family protein [Bacillota bacterium]|nr:CinA family protein [Bacillota bacterium]
METKNEENIRFSERYLLFGIDREQIENLIKEHELNYKRVGIRINDDEGEPTVELSSSEQKYLTKARKRFVEIFSDYLFFPPNRTLAEAFFETLEKRNLQVSTAESVTGGMIASRILDQPGASKIMKEAFVVYSNQAKMDLLGINPKTIQKYGVVSEEVASEMADRLQNVSGANIAIATTGIAGPDGGTEDIPVGTVFFGFVITKDKSTERKQFSGDRNEIRKKATAYAMAYVINRLNNK